ncbi:hypothetical protein PHYSODRAFT_334876 [Phytophthora sojae]|uniref:Uncharacterized protein n=1 Tax=Phytophthora sojae (strain P6497) TaxID=1094619 RepID=G4ZSX2_PHYSP|nr:hypothetical protein PHYSODRAFT_334876 [Phytophthora sojae]EGZ13057.1 hypothetical protein PHYSODRAFT_334876 [Phytophthora sojae]|eukprot:XP_009530486.1 hypothetical protein PHYSODRAFT_334876 [Phytophthora sojae]
MEEANEATWEFLQPWVDAFRSRVTLNGPKAATAYVLGSLDYWTFSQDGFPVAIDTFALYLSFPADEATRTRDRQLLQTVREALELFTIIAAADNPAIVQVLAEFVSKVKIVVDDERGNKPHLVLPDWKCWLDGRLSESDPLARQPSITWGDLYGCPEDPETNSLEFRAAKENSRDWRRDKARTGLYTADCAVESHSRGSGEAEKEKKSFYRDNRGLCYESFLVSTYPRLFS